MAQVERKNKSKLHPKKQFFYIHPLPPEAACRSCSSKKCAANLQENTPTPKENFNIVAKKLY